MKTLLSILASSAFYINAKTNSPEKKPPSPKAPVVNLMHHIQSGMQLCENASAGQADLEISPSGELTQKKITEGGVKWIEETIL